MYHYTLNILICSKEIVLAQWISQLSFPERFTYHIESHLSPDKSQMLQADLIITDPPARGLKVLRASCKSGAILLCCATSETIATLPSIDFLSADNYLEMPLDPRLTVLRLQEVLETIGTKKELWLHHNYLDTMINSVPDMIWFKDITGKHLSVNDSFAHTVNKSKADIAGKYHYYIWDIPVEEYQKGEYVCVETEDIVIEARQTCLFMEKVKTRNGMRQFKTYKSPIFAEDNTTIIGTVGVAHDVTDLENISTELEILLHSIPFAVLLSNAEDEIINLNQKFEQCFAVDKGQLLGKSFSDWEKKIFVNGFTTNVEGYTEATVHVSSTGDALTLEIHRQTIYDVFHNDVGDLCIFRDVTRERALEQKLLQNLNTDFLTGLFNRRYFYQSILTSLNGQMVSLLYVDLDHFKEINDTYGHNMGDEALIHTAQILQNSFPNALIARLGGDEFIVALLGDYTLFALEEMAQELLDRIRLVFDASEHLNILSASIGIVQSLHPNLEIDIDLLIHQSDIALYEAKKNGKNCYRVYHPTK